PTHGVEVEYVDDCINIDIYIIVEYGTRIKSVASSVANTVRYHVEKALGLPLNEINVHIQGLRISELSE
ncbi:MAG: Asp23/Gls24 family envelope stress response protein, partial [Chloroflexi bacterium]|nr:Asp23/Gls24 family envelope stress response protein [Chloroflexota bacterium]